MAFAILCGVALFGSAGCGSDSKKPTVDAGGDIGVTDAPTCPASCDDQNDCTIDICDSSTSQCVHQPKSDGTSCEDGNACSIKDICQGGLCYSGPYKTCTALDVCHAVGACSPKTGECSNPNAQNGKACNDGLRCTTGDQCNDGECKGTATPCPGLAICEPDTGVCVNSQAPTLPLFPAALSAGVFPNTQGPSKGNGLVRTADGRIFVAGVFFDTTDLGTGPISTGLPRGGLNPDIFAAQIDPNTEKAIWTQSFLGPQRQSVTAFAASGDGELGLVGSLQGAVMVGTVELDSFYTGDQYMLGLGSKDGAGLWIRRVNLQGSLSSPVANGLYGIAGDPQSSAFIVCGTATKDATDLSSSLKGAWRGGQDIVLAGIDGSTGNTVWAAQVGGTNDEDCDAVAVDSQSNIYVVGSYRFASTVSFGTLVLPVVEDPATVRMFLAKLDSTGQGIWNVSLGDGQQTVTPSAVLVTGSDVVVVGTVNTGKLSLGGVDLGGAETFVGRFDGTTGRADWIEGIGAGGGLSVSGVAEGPNREILLTGNYFSPAVIGTFPMPGPSTLGGIFVAQLGGEGKVLAAKGYGDPTFGSIAAGVIGRTDAVGAEVGSSLLLGSFGAKIDLGPPVGLLNSNLTAIGATALFLAKLAP